MQDVPLGARCALGNAIRYIPPDGGMQHSIFDGILPGEEIKVFVDNSGTIFTWKPPSGNSPRPMAQS